METTLFKKFAAAAFISGACIVGTAQAETLQVSIEIPRLNVAEYHKPYVAVWLEDEARNATQIAVWYDLEMRNNEGEKWLKDLRQWWRRGGREQTMPIDGVTGATRPVGEHTLKFPGNGKHLQGLKDGKYNLVVEASREVGGREVLRVPFEWPGKQQRGTAQGKTELGTVTLDVSP